MEAKSALGTTKNNTYSLYGKLASLYTTTLQIADHLVCKV